MPGPLPDPQEIGPGIIADQILSVFVRKPSDYQAVWDVVFKAVLKFGQGEFERGQEYAVAMAEKPPTLVVPKVDLQPPALPKLEPDRMSVPPPLPGMPAVRESHHSLPMEYSIPIFEINH